MQRLLRAAALAAVVAAGAAENAAVSRVFDCAASQFTLEWLSEARVLAECRDGRYGRLNVSDDRGRNWEEVIPQGCTDSNGCVRRVFVEDSQHAVLETTSGAVEWESSKGAGTTYTVTVNGERIRLQRVVSHPDVAANGMVLGLQREPSKLCIDRRCSYNVFLSKDKGKTFRKAYSDPVLQADFSGEKGHPDELMLVLDAVHGVTRTFTWLAAYNLKTEQTRVVLEGCTYFLPLGSFTYYLVEDDHKRRSLHVSADDGATIDRAVFPSADAEEQYTVVSLGVHNAFVAVYHTDCTLKSDAPWAKLYQSDVSGELFSLSLDNIRYSMETNSPDFHRAGGLAGIFIATQVDREGCADCASWVECTSQCTFFTVRSSDNADPGSWRKIPAPETERAACHDKSNCYLHLHDMASAEEHLSTIKSRPDSPGVVMGVGNVGAGLDLQANVADVYLSLDAGETWKKVLDGPHHYDWSNYGGLIVAVRSGVSAKQLSYSFDMGASFSTMAFDQPIKVTSVEAAGRYRADPQHTVFVISGSDEGDRAVVISVDLAPVKPAACDPAPNVGKNFLPDTFRLFRPKGTAEGGDCFMGSKESFVQKKAGKSCWNPVPSVEMDRIWAQERCPCKLEDYGCSPNFKYSEASGKPRCLSRLEKKAVWDVEKGQWTVDQESHLPGFCTGKTYKRSKGYELRPGFQCDPKAAGGIDLLPVDTPCPAELIVGDDGGAFGTVLLVLFLLVVAFVVIVYVLARFMENPTAIGIWLIIEEMATCCVEFCKSCTGSAAEKYTRASAARPQEVDVLSNDDVEDDRSEVEARGAFAAPAAPARPVNVDMAEVPAAPAAPPADAAKEQPRRPADDDDDFAALGSGAPPAPAQEQPRQGQASGDNPLDDIFS